MESSAAPAASKADLEKIAEFNRTDAPFPDQVTLQELMETKFAECASATAVVCEHDKLFGVPSLTYGELNRKANQLAHRLRAAGVGPGQIVGLMVERSFAMMIGILGILKAGAAYLPLSPDNPAARLDYLLSDAGVKVLLVHAKTAGRTAFSGLTIDLDDPGNLSRAGGKSEPHQYRARPGLRDLYLGLDRQT